MRLKLAVSMALFLPVICWTQSAAPSTSKLDPATGQALVKLGGQLMVDGKAYDYDRHLADDIGPRLTGSDNYMTAAAWATDEFKKMGLENAHEEDWEITAAWEPEVWATGEILAPHKQRLHLEADGWSVSTPEGGVKGKVYHLKELSPESVKAEADGIKDAVVLIDEDSFPKNGEFLIGKMLDAIDEMKQEGAKALLLGIGATNNVPSMAGLSCCNGAPTALPTGNVGEEDTLLLRRLLDEGPVEVEFRFKNRIRDHVKVPNVVAEIPGTDGSGEYVVIGGHLDSWQLGTGAEDNGTGAASVLAVAEAMKASGVQPRRTMRFILFGGEEEGLLGSIQYVRAHTAEMDKCAGVFITDTGSEAPKGWYIFGRADEKTALEPIKPMLDELGAGGTTDDGRFTFSTDHGAFLIHGVPAYMLWNPTDEYFKLHHKPSDTFDKVNQRDLNLGVAVVGVTALAFADAPAMLPHPDQAGVEAQLKKIKAYDEYKDMVDHKNF
ncbi:MAG TPA: M20/M25/M40 family metallo-hydrolase [Terracidiphilus sp.]|nr:M20/M25/M40 family metallo-hydrolase [Terracidiphilus sp.]